jgi:hypothetical protein
MSLAENSNLNVFILFQVGVCPVPSRQSVSTDYNSGATLYWTVKWVLHDLNGLP